ncbi:MAG: NADH-ubiquinone oxidoreductase chain [Dehalococcoidia bacterium]|nr:NADH-ubiquinone oxidoreductase chain [Dehalococcoidia bacterium]
MQLGLGASIAFWIIAAVAVASCLAVITLRNIFHAALFLVVSFLSMAGLFATLSADFVAVVEILIYAGAISILLIFALLLTREYQQGNLSNRMQLPGLFLGGLTLVTLVVVFLNTNWARTASASAIDQDRATTALIADALFNRFVLPFEIAAVLLLAAVIGAIVLAREES